MTMTITMSMTITGTMKKFTLLVISTDIENEVRNNQLIQTDIL